MNTRITHTADHAASLSPRQVPYLAIFVVWTLFGLWTVEQNAMLRVTSGEPITSWPRLFVVPMAAAWFWAAITPLLMWHTRRIREQTTSRSTTIAIHLATFVVVHIIDVAFYGYLREVAGDPTRPFTQLLFSVASYNALTYGVVIGATTALDYRAALRDRAMRTAQLESQLANAHFHALRAQLHPHFLFNSLNAVSALIQKQPERAERMLARLSELLRMAIDTAVTPEVPLADEVEFAKRYLEIERMRFGSRLDVRICIDDDTLDSLVPSMLLQPLVENAVRHGVAPHPGAGRVVIHAQRDGDRLRITVGDTGPGIEHDARFDETQEGVGLRATRERLETLYGREQQLALTNVPGGFETRVTIPFRQRQEVHA